ncbi:hypothetical protein CspeluHIS016_0108720 [Cutaneotrichosporon spelunceum]|uniref:Uncharacterized protein n=1 Tax=Cutaneotrichosporon spelunceum TaxID=1672016 RepID=A0AAD3TPS6_9TREE|nr:hypothetical protein CspeluHIS016_0108720 [Cutaneotrichosporon spelunceum]
MTRMTDAASRNGRRPLLAPLPAQCREGLTGEKVQLCTITQFTICHRFHHGAVRYSRWHSNPEAVLAAEIVVVGVFARRVRTVIGALQAQMAPYDSTIPRMRLITVWREIGDRITARSNAGRRTEGSNRHAVSADSESTRGEVGGRSRKRRREREDGPATGVLPLLVGTDWIVAVADAVTGSVVIYDGGHALDAVEVDIVGDEVMRAWAETIGEDVMRLEVRHLRPPDRVPEGHTVLLAGAALEVLGSSPVPIDDRSLLVYLGLWSKLFAQGITLAIPPSFDRPSAAQSPLYAKGMSASRALRDRIV